MKNNLTAVLVFIDFKKAFDSINHETMFKILHAYGIPPKMLAAIKLCYQNLKAKVVSPDGDTDMFKIHAGVMQRKATRWHLSCLLLCLTMLCTMQLVEERMNLA